MKNATVIDTRGSSDRSDDAYSNEINTTSKLVSALDKGLVVADVYVDDGEIIFVAVKAVSYTHLAAGRDGGPFHLPV